MDVSDLEETGGLYHHIRMSVGGIHAFSIHFRFPLALHISVTLGRSLVYGLTSLLNAWHNPVLESDSVWSQPIESLTWVLTLSY
ncbi:hypothetical protein VTL71DRAFT_7688 [Oculimacula yallundae]|uniref:Uncharacterized protein n=1 Tax=Oculimacula yallundae TaxID=86028 RepID=A0ABR4BUT5_9HELO